MSLNWNGDKIKAKVEAASIKAVDRVMSECVQTAKRNHPGWKNITGTAEGSIRVVKFAELKGRAIVGQWGSSSVLYMKWLEFKHGSALRSAADVCYPKLAGYIREYLH